MLLWLSFSGSAFGLLRWSCCCCWSWAKGFRNCCCFCCYLTGRSHTFGINTPGCGSWWAWWTSWVFGWDAVFHLSSSNSCRTRHSRPTKALVYYGQRMREEEPRRRGEKKSQRSVIETQVFAHQSWLWKNKYFKQNGHTQNTGKSCRTKWMDTRKHTRVIICYYADWSGW